MSFFGVVANGGSYRATKREYKFLFHAKTTIIRCEDVTIPINGFSIINFEEVKKTNGESEHLIDVMGVLIAMSAEKVSVKDGRTTRIIQLELLDEK
ncbi:Replication factor A protein [Spatholobus suberectus]|nr:Replication factor A protein [Spatholobus suberectus]